MQALYHTSVKEEEIGSAKGFRKAMSNITDKMFWYRMEIPANIERI
jgi:hypothetical protein